MKGSFPRPVVRDGRLGQRALAIATAVVLAGCSTILAVGEQNAMLDANAVLGGTVRLEGRSPRGPLVVGIAARSPSGFRLVDHFVSENGGPWVLALQAGTYWVMAFEDANSNGRYDDEPAWRPDEKDSITLGQGEHRIDLALAIPEAGRFVQKAFSLEEAQFRGREEQQSFSLYALSAAGEQVSLDDPRFAPQIAKEGMWQPYNFLLRAHPGIYFLEPYDPARIPVLFVHGIGGSPTDFREIIASLDRRRFQPWVAYYPSGARLENIARWISQVFTRLRTRHRFEKAVVVAHSMGGLVSRGFLLEDWEANASPTVRGFVTISSPLGGMASAGKGVEDSPVVIRSWYGLAPGSDFLDGLFYRDLPARRTRRTLPPHVRYDMLFGFRGSSGDGIVAFSSQLRPEAQQEARSLRGFDETHTGILRSPAAIAHVNDILAAVE